VTPITDAGLGCGVTYAVSGSCVTDATPCWMLCQQAGSAGAGCSLTANSGDSATLSCFSCITGRRPRGLRSVGRPSTASEVGSVLAEMAHLEAASVFSFERLAAELSAHGAPGRLAARSKAAAGDEVRHARVMTRLAARAGAEVKAPRVRRPTTRGLEAIARENAVEGCVRETYGAALAHVQAARATDPRVRAAMSKIARDETRHAQLSWDVARWIEAQLAPAARRRVAAARSRAIAELGRALAGPGSDADRAALGWPDAAQAKALHAALRDSLWV
jgi:hypothetical protein